MAVDIACATAEKQGVSRRRKRSRSRCSIRGAVDEEGGDGAIALVVAESLWRQS